MEPYYRNGVEGWRRSEREGGEGSMIGCFDEWMDGWMDGWFPLPCT